MALQVQIAARNKIEAELNKTVTNMELPAEAPKQKSCVFRNLPTR